MDAPPPPSTGRTWDELVELYLDGPGAAKADATQVRDRYRIRHLYPEFTGRNLDRIDGAMVRAYIAKRQEDGASNGTVRGELALMTAIVNWGIHELEWPLKNPWAKRRPPQDEQRDKWLTREEAARLMDAAEGLARGKRGWRYLPDFIALCLYAGLRREEAMNLTWDRVYLDNGTIRFGAKDQKSRKASTIPINRQARMALLSRLEATGGTGRVFPKTDPWHAFQKAVAAAGLEDVRIHDLRRTFGSWLAQDGVPIQQISRLMRHGSVVVTDKVYAHLSTETLMEATKVLDGPARLRAVK